MNAQRRNAGIQRELRAISGLGLITEAQHSALAARYPTTPWNAAVLVRWFTILGAVGMGAGVVLLLRHMAAPVRLVELGTLITCGGLLFAGAVLQRKQMPKSAAAAQLAGAFALQGLTVALAIDFSSGSKNWPALIGVDAALLLLLAYGLGNRLVLIYALVNAFTFFGGESGYVSGWGMYFLGLTYPGRFLLIGAGTLGVAWAHAAYLRDAWQSFARVYAHYGLLLINLSCWFLSLFGWFDERSFGLGGQAERLTFSVMWAGMSVASLMLASKLGQRILRSYGLVFLTINAYTFYFQFVVAHSLEMWFIHLLLTGGTMVAAGAWLERELREPRSPAATG